MINIANINEIIYILYASLQHEKSQSHMKKVHLILATMFGSILFTSCQNATTQQQTEVNPEGTHQEAPVEKPVINTPDDALAELKRGNERFLSGKLMNTNFKDQIEQTKMDQHPHSLILSCLDSRIPPEIIFDQGIGNTFVARVAGNIEDANILGSMEFATKVKGTKCIVVMGHNKCGAVKGAIDNAALGNLTQLVAQIKPAITGDKANPDAMLNETAMKNVQLTMDDIVKKSTVIKELVAEGKVKIVGAFYDLESGKVTFM